MFHFSLKLHIQFWKYFRSMVLYSVGSDYYKKESVRFSCQNVFDQTENVTLVKFSYEIYFFFSKR